MKETILACHDTDQGSIPNLVTIWQLQWFYPFHTFLIIVHHKAGKANAYKMAARYWFVRLATLSRVARTLNAKRLQFKLPKTIHGKSPVSYLCKVYFFSELIKSRFHFVKVKFELYLNDKVYILTCIKVANKTC